LSPASKPITGISREAAPYDKRESGKLVVEVRIEIKNEDVPSGRSRDPRRLTA
jgi:hypothetical protein